MKHSRKKLVSGSVLLLVSVLLIMPVLANSARTTWYGTDSTGAIIKEKDCPIVVEHE